MKETANCDENLVSKNYRNSYSKKTVETQFGEVEINVPRHNKSADYVVLGINLDGYNFTPTCIRSFLVLCGKFML